MCSLPSILAAFLVLSIAKCSDSHDEKPVKQYAVPEPKINVFAKGFRVAIPDQEGIKLFAFHGNINHPMNDLEAGEFSKDILKKEENHWVFEDTKTKLEVGDVIYYWLFVIRFNLGYRYDNGKFEVKEIMPYTSIQSDQPSPSHAPKDSQSNWYFEPIDRPAPVFNSKVQTQTSPALPTVHKPVSTCCQLFLNVSNQIITLSEQIDKLTEENKILSQLAEKDDHYATTLRIFGKYPSEYYPTPKEFVQNLIEEKLGLLGVTVQEAKKIPDNGISFKVKTLSDKVKIIVAGQGKLGGSNYELSW